MRRIKALWIMFVLALGRGVIRIFGAPADKRAEFEQMQAEFRRKMEERPV